MDHDVLVRHQAIDAVVPSLPPVLRRPLVQQQRGALLEGQLPGRSAHVVKLGDGFDGLPLCPERGRNRRSESDRAEVSVRRLSRRPMNADGHSSCLCALSLYVTACARGAVLSRSDISVAVDTNPPGQLRARAATGPQEL